MDLPLDFGETLARFYTAVTSLGTVTVISCILGLNLWLLQHLCGVNNGNLLIHQQFYLLTIVFSYVSQGNTDRSNRIISHVGDAKTEMLKVLR